MGLKESRWAASGHNHASTLRTWPQSAPSTPHPRSEQLPLPTNGSADPGIVRPSRSSPERELDRYLKLVARLKWKLPFLAEGYRIATDRVGRRSEDVAANEIHFKIDFYEYVVAPVVPCCTLPETNC